MSAKLYEREGQAGDFLGYNCNFQIPARLVGRLAVLAASLLPFLFVQIF